MSSEHKLCGVCNKMFIPYRPNQRYCSDKCRIKIYKVRYKYKRKEVSEKRCLVCNELFKTNDNKKKFCSEICSKEYRDSSYKYITPTKRICLVCGEQFISAHTAKKYCGTECYLIAKKERSNAKI